jgi:hypothetical protein
MQTEKIIKLFPVDFLAVQKGCNMCITLAVDTYLYW